MADYSSYKIALGYTGDWSIPQHAHIDATEAVATTVEGLGSVYQAKDATLTALAGVTTAADKLIYATGADTFSTTTFTVAGRALVDDADAAAQRTTLGLGTAATYATGTSGSTVPLLSGANTWGDAQYLQLGAAAAPSLSFTGDTNTGIWSSIGDSISISTAGVERFKIGSTGNIYIGDTASRTIGDTGGSIQSSGTSATVGLTIAKYSNDTTNPIIALGKSRATAIGTYTVVQNNDTLGKLQFAGADGTDLQTVGAEIKAEVDGAPGSNDMPSRLVFSTTADGAASPTERMRIDSAGKVSISNGNLAFSTGYGIDFSATGGAAGITSSLLDDYEEGTWTPSISTYDGTESGQTYSTQVGTYTKIGDYVFLSGQVTLSAKGTTTGTGLVISGLPFTISSIGGTVNGGGVVPYYTSLDINLYDVSLWTRIGTSQFFVGGNTSAGTSKTVLSYSSLNDTSNFYISAKYKVA